jgi:hypothetical protein
MKNKSVITEAAQAYAAAYNSHYTGHDLPLALQLYRKLVAFHPDAPEADYSRLQIQNIVHAVVPKQELFDAQVALVLAHLERDFPHAVGRAATPSGVVEIPGQ